MADLLSQRVAIQDEDIFFFCSSCGKSMVIDARAVGLMVDCPSCRREVEVPHESQEAPPPTAVIPPDGNAEERIAALTHALEVAQNDIQRLSVHLSEVSKRRAYLEQLRAANMRHMEQIAAHMNTIHAAVDSIVAILRETATEGVSDPASPRSETP